MTAVAFPNPPGAPLRALRGVAHVHLAPGESKSVRFELGARDRSHVNERGEHLVGAGVYRLSVGGGQPTEPTTKVEANLKIVGRRVLDP